MQRMYIEVPYADKDEAKSLGARWDVDAKKWYVTDDILLFQKWFTKKVVDKKHKTEDARITLSAFLSSNYRGPVGLTLRSAKAFNIPYPLKSGWAKRYADNTAKISSLTVGKKGKKVNKPAYKPICNCTNPPWEDCEHTDALAMAAMKSILS